VSDPKDGREGWEGFAEEASAGTLGPSAELEEAMREAEASHDARAAARQGAKTGEGDPAHQELTAALEAAQREIAELKDKYLRLAADQAPALHDRLAGLGMDSLMAVQMRNALVRATALPRGLPATLIFDHPTIEAIARLLLARLAAAGSEATAAQAAGTATGTAPPAPTTPAPLDAAAVAALSDDDIARLLDERLKTP